MAIIRKAVPTDLEAVNRLLEEMLGLKPQYTSMEMILER